MNSGEYITIDKFNNRGGGTSLPTVYIFWTGGWDSTYRIVELSRKKVVIKPIYCIDPGRGSTEYEIKAMNSISAALAACEQTLAIIEPVELIRVEDIPVNDKITRAFKSISAKVKLGSQYEWLACLAQKFCGIEIGIEKPNGEFSGCVEAIAEFGNFVYDEDAYIVDNKSSSPECVELFGNFRFPIINTTEVQMLNNIKAWGYEDVMRLIWFCHSPINGVPCGYCRPCQQKMECNMQWLLPDKAQKRYRTFKKISKISPKFATKISNLIYRKFK